MMNKKIKFAKFLAKGEAIVVRNFFWALPDKTMKYSCQRRSNSSEEFHRGFASLKGDS